MAARHWAARASLVIRRAAMEEAELEHGALMAVLNETFIKHYFPDTNLLSGSVKIAKLKSNSKETLVAPGNLARLADANPYAFLPEVVITLYNLTNFYCSIEPIEEPVTCSSLRYARRGCARVGWTRKFEVRV
jgi:hypothetical protein